MRLEKSGFFLSSLGTLLFGILVLGDSHGKDTNLTPFLGEDQAKAFLKFEHEAKIGLPAYSRQQRRHEFWGKRGEFDNDSDSYPLRITAPQPPIASAEGPFDFSTNSNKRHNYDFVGKRHNYDFVGKRRNYDFVGKRGSMLFVQRSYKLNRGQMENPLSLLRAALYTSPSESVHSVNSRAKHEFVGKRGDQNPPFSVPSYQKITGLSREKRPSPSEVEVSGKHYENTDMDIIVPSLNQLLERISSAHQSEIMDNSDMSPKRDWERPSDETDAEHAFLDSIKSPAIEPDSNHHSSPEIAEELSELKDSLDNKRGYEFLGKRGFEFLGKRDDDKRGYDFVGKRRAYDFIGKRRGYDFVGKRDLHEVPVSNEDDKRGFEFMGGKRGFEFLGKRNGDKRGFEFLGKKSTDKRGFEFLGKRDPRENGEDKRGYEFLGKRRNYDFIGKRGFEFMGGKRGFEFLG